MSLEDDNELKSAGFQPSGNALLRISFFNTQFANAKELAKKLMEVQEDVEIMINFATGKEANVEIKFEPKTED